MKRILIWSAALAALAMTSCSKTESAADSSYVSVQIEDSQMWSLLDVANGQIVMSDEFFAPASGVVKGSFFVENDNRKFDLYNLKDTKNKLNRTSFTTVTNFNPDGFAIVRVEEEPWQIIDTEGNVVATLDKSLMVSSGFSAEGLAKIENKDGMVGYVNTKGETPIKPRYKFGTIFSDGLAFVLTKQENNHNYFSAISPAGESVFTFSDAKYSEIGLFNQGHAFAVEGDHSVLIDKTGKKLLTVCPGTQIANLSYDNGNIIYYDGEFYGVKDTQDKILIRAKYQHLKFQSDGNLLARNNNGKYGVITVSDDIVTPFDYDELEYLAPGRYITKSGNVDVLIDSKGKEICDKAFSNYLNRSSSASENNLASLISADTNTAEANEFDSSSYSGGAGLNLLDFEDYDTGYSSARMRSEIGDEIIEVGEYEGLIDDKTKIIMEITSIEGNKIMGNTYYPNSVAKYGKTPQTMMPFTGTIEDNAIIHMIVKSPTDVTYGETWDIVIGDVMMGGTIRTTTGKEWSVEFNNY